MAKLTKLRREALQALADGALMTIDKQNAAFINGKEVALVNRYFFTKNRLVTRLDKNRAVEASGNGFIITEKGRKIIDE